MAKFDPHHAVVPPTNFGDKNSAEQFLGCGKFRQCANLTLIYGHQHSPAVSVYLPICKESRFERTGVAKGIPMPVVNTPISPVTYMTVATWAPLISCPEKCRGYRSRGWAKVLRWIRPNATQKATQMEAPTSGVLSNGWVQGFGVTCIVAFVAFVVANIIQTAVRETALAFVAALIPTLFTILVVRSRTPRNTESGRDALSKFPQRGDHHQSTSQTRANSDGSITIESTVARQIDRRPQLWEAVANKFRSLSDKPIPIRGEWIYTFETRHYQWSVRHPSDTAVKLCIEICKEAGRLLLADPSFRQKFPDIAAITDDGDRWLLAIYKVAKIGKVTAKLNSSTYGVVTTGEGGEINDLPGASQVLCQMALNGF
jgi:hypothetical protein